MPVKRNISYSDLNKTPERNQLDVYYEQTFDNTPVFVFIHGGSWSQGSKDIYSQLGINLNKHGICTVIINYRLAPSVQINEMAHDCGKAVKWVIGNIAVYGGNADKIFLMGHSAGGHLSALISLDPSYELINKIKGLVLVDAFGLNMAHFLENHKTNYNHLVEMVFGSTKDLWLKYSPSTYLKSKGPRILIYTGSSTYPFIKQDNKLFHQHALESGFKSELRTVRGADHFTIIHSLKDSDHNFYEEMKDFT
jgi:acetyl esterase/lipase